MCGQPKCEQGSHSPREELQFTRTVPAAEAYSRPGAGLGGPLEECQHAVTLGDAWWWAGNSGWGETGRCTRAGIWTMACGWVQLKVGVERSRDENDKQGRWGEVDATIRKPEQKAFLEGHPCAKS